MFIKKEHNRIVQAPVNLITKTKIIVNYSGEHNRDMLLADGYLEYDGNHPLFFLDIVDDEIIEKEIPERKNVKIYSRYKVKLKLNSLGYWTDIRESFNDDEWENFILANELSMEDENFVDAIEKIKTQIPNILALIEDCGV